MIKSYLKSFFISQNDIVSEKFDVDFSINLTSLLNVYKYYIVIAIMVLSFSSFYIDIPTFADSQNKSLLEINSTDIEILINKANNLYAQEKYDEALQYYNKALAINPSYVDAINGKGNVLNALYNKADALKNLERYDEAFSLMQKVILWNPNNIYFQKTMAFILYNLGNTDKAKLSYNKALQINNNLTSIMSEKELTVFNKLMNNNTTK